MMPPAPPRFSITTAWPRLSCSAGTKLRAAISVPPPGAAGTMRWIGRVGYCAAAGGMAKCAANITRESVAIGLVIARRPTNPRLPKKKAQPAKRTGYALNSLGDYPRMASRARVCHGGGFSLFRRFSAGVRQHLVGDAHVRLAVRGNSVVGLRGGAARGSARRDPGRAVRHADPHLRHNRHRSDDDCRRHADRAGGLDPRSRHDVRGDHDRVQRDGRTLIASGWLALPRADLQLAGGKRVPGGNHSARRAGADSPGFHLVSGSDAVAAARDFSDGDVGGAVRRLPRNPDAEAPPVFHRRRRRDRKGIGYRRPAAGVLPRRAAGLLHRADHRAVEEDRGADRLRRDGGRCARRVGGLRRRRAYPLARVARRSSGGARQSAPTLDQPPARLGAREHQPDDSRRSRHCNDHRAHGCAGPGRRRRSTPRADIRYDAAHVRQWAHQHPAGGGAPPAVLYVHRTHPGTLNGQLRSEADIQKGAPRPGYSRTKITFTALTSTRTESPFFTPRSARVSSVMTEVISIGPSTLILTWLIREPFLISATFPTTLFRASYFIRPFKELMLSR